MSSFVYVNGVLNIMVNSRLVTVTPEHHNYKLIKKALVNNDDLQLECMLYCDIEADVQSYLNRQTKGVAEYKDGTVYLNGKELHNTLAEKVKELAKEDLPFENILSFIENVELNPSQNSRNELYDFLSNKGLPLTEDGCFLALKAVRSDYLDKYTGTIDNSPGRTISMDRALVDNNRNHQCSKGLHVGALDYVKSYGNSNDVIMVVKVHPKNAVSVPKDSNFQKLRCCEYEVLYELQDALKFSVYTSNGNPVDNDVDIEDYYDEDDDDFYEQLEKEYDDYYDDGDVTSINVNVDDYDSINGSVDYSYKPSGQKYYNGRDLKGRFVKR